MAAAPASTKARPSRPAQSGNQRDDAQEDVAMLFHVQRPEVRNRNVGQPQAGIRWKISAQERQRVEHVVPLRKASHAHGAVDCRDVEQEGREYAADAALKKPPAAPASQRESGTSGSLRARKTRPRRAGPTDSRRGKEMRLQAQRDGQPPPAVEIIDVPHSASGRGRGMSRPPFRSPAQARRARLSDPVAANQRRHVLLQTELLLTNAFSTTAHRFPLPRVKYERGNLVRQIPRVAGLDKEAGFPLFDQFRDTPVRVPMSGLPAAIASTMVKPKASCQRETWQAMSQAAQRPSPSGSRTRPANVTCTEIQAARRGGSYSPRCGPSPARRKWTSAPPSSTGAGRRPNRSGTPFSDRSASA